MKFPNLVFPGFDPVLAHLMWESILADEEDEMVEEEEEVEEGDTNGAGRKEHWHRNRIDWCNHVLKSLHEGMWHTKYRMSYPAFENLVNILRDDLRRVSANCRSGAPITAEIIVGMGIRWLAGEKYQSLVDIFDVSRTEHYKCRKDFISALLRNKTLGIKLPKCPEDWEDVRSGFARKSYLQLFHGCCGALDGFFQPMNKPTIGECNKPIGYHSGHYKSYGVNCQGACDSRLRFLFFGVVGAGTCHDSNALDTAAGLKEAIDSLCLGLYFVGDAAYNLSERLLVPFTGSQREDPDKDAFNFYLSQLRIRIEMAFGRLVNKWRILKTKLECDLTRNAEIIMCCAILHNYVINADNIGADDTMEGEESDTMEGDDTIATNDFIIRNAPSGMSYLPNIPEDFEEIEGTSQTRTAIIEDITDMNLRRPDHNIQRNAPAAANEPQIPDEYYHPT
jgi:hypothetical protein